MIAGLVVVTGCADSDGGVSSSTSVVTATTMVTDPATDLAPSQRTASTVARPETTPPCDPSRLAFEAVGGTDPSSVTVITITNRGDARCEVDVSDSPSVDPLMEPDVWLEPGQRAELVVATAPDCAATTAAASIALVVNGDQVDVPIPPIDACPLTLTAFYSV